MATVLLSLMASLGGAAGAAGVAVRVRIVDREAMPLSGIQITVHEVKGCGRSSQVSGPIREGTWSRSVTRASVRAILRRGNCRFTLLPASRLIASFGPTRSTSPTMGRAWSLNLQMGM